MGTENHDKVWAIVRDAMNGAISINDAVARIKGLQDATEMTEENYEMADNVNPKKADESEKDRKGQGTDVTALQEESVQNELAFGNTADPGEGADADFNDIVGNDTGSDTDSLGVVPEDQVGTGELKGGVVVAKDVDPDVKTTDDGARAKPADESNEVVPEVEENTAQENQTKTLSKRQQKKLAAKEAAQENDKS